MPDSKPLPCPMCPSCKHYTFASGHSAPHRCADSGSFTNGSKLGQNPPANQCKAFKPR